MARQHFTRTSQPVQRALTAVAAATVGLALGIPTVWAVSADPVRSGDAVIVDGNDGSHELSHGQSATQFSLRLPPTATCPGDSANDQWRFQTFMVPAADDPGTLHYGVGGPDGPGQFPLFQVNTAQLVDNLINQNTRPGQPGVIPAIPPLSLAAFPPDVLPSGTYRIGIACTLSRKTANYWDTEIVITASPNDKPSQFVWRLPNAPQSVDEPHKGSSRWLLPAGLGVLSVATLAAWFWLPRKSPPGELNARRTSAKVNIRSTPNKLTKPRPGRAVTNSKEPQ